MAQNSMLNKWKPSEGWFDMKATDMFLSLTLEES